MQAWSFRVADFRPVQIEGLKFFGEWVLQKGVDDQGGVEKIKRLVGILRMNTKFLLVLINL